MKFKRHIKVYLKILSVGVFIYYTCIYCSIIYHTRRRKNKAFYYDDGHKIIRYNKLLSLNKIELKMFKTNLYS